MLALLLLGTLLHRDQLPTQALFQSTCQHQQPPLTLAFGQLQHLALITLAALFLQALQLAHLPAL
jgi:hypothetical protein